MKAFLTAIVIVAAFTLGAHAQLFDFTTYAGSAAQGDVDGVTNLAEFNNPGGVAMDVFGNIYIADTADDTIRKITPNGTVSTFAGMPGMSGSLDGLGTNALFNAPQGVAVDSSGNVYVADTGNFTIRKITTGGSVNTLAGLAGNSGSADGSGTNALFYEPEGITVDTSGNIFVADTWNDTIREVSPMGMVKTIGGWAGNFGSTNATGTNALFYEPGGVAVDGSDDVFVADTGNNAIREIAANGTVSTLAGAVGSFGSLDARGTNALFDSPEGIALDSSGNVYVADSLNDTIRTVTPAGVVTTIAGSPGILGSVDGTNALFWGAQGLAVNPTNNNILYVADTGNSTIRQAVSSSGTWTISTLAGEASIGSLNATGSVARFFWPMDVAADGQGNFYVADSANNTIRKITAGGTVSTFAGFPGVSGSANGQGTNASFNAPQGVAVDSSGNVYVTDTGNSTVREITSEGMVSTLAGSAGNPGSSDGSGTGAQFNEPEGIAVNGSVVFVADTWNHTIREINGGVVTTLVGIAGNPGSVDGTNGVAQFNRPTGLAIDGSGNLFVSDLLNHTIREITPGGVVSTLAGLPEVIGSTDGTNNSARFFEPEGIAVDSQDNVYVADAGNYTIRQLTPSGTNWGVSTIAGWAGTSGSVDGSGIGARFCYPAGMAWSAGTLYVADSANNTFRGGTVITDSPPMILTQPQSQSMEVGTAVSFSVSATGGTLYYQWEFDGTNIPGATASTYFLPSVQSANTGTYSVWVSSPTGSTLSSNAVLMLVSPPVITNQPVSITVAAGTTATFSVMATGTTPLFYQWLKNGTGMSNGGNISGATTATLMLSGVSSNNAASYSVIVTNVYGSTTSSVATLTIAYASITNQPVSQSCLQGSTVSFSVTAGPPPLTYQWYVYGQPLANGAGIGGANTATLTLTNVTTANNGSYTVVINNSYGYISSSPATLTVFTVPLADSIQPTAWWLLNEGIGTNAYDYSGNGHTNTLNSGVSWTSAGYSGNGAYFNATEFSLITIGHPFNLTANWTATMWVNRWESKSVSTLISGTTYALKLEQYNSTNRVGYTHYSVVDNTLGYTTPLNTWVHLAFVETSSGVAVYADGVLMATNAATSSLNATALGLDNYTTYTDYLDATLDDVRIYNQALTQQQITNIYAYGRISPIPAITLTAPTNDAAFIVSSNITLTASVVTNAQSIVGVQFYQGTTLLGQNNISPYTWTWTNAPAGNYSLTADAVYNGSSTVASAPIDIFVTPSTTQPDLAISETNGVFQLSWPADHTGWRLLAQTNSNTVGLSTNWSTVTGSTNTDQITAPVPVSGQSIFYRLVYP